MKRSVELVLGAILLGLLLQRAKINAVAIACSTSIPSALTLLPPFLMYEMPVLSDTGHAKHKFVGVNELLITVCVLAMLYNLSRLYLIKYTAGLFLCLLSMTLMLNFLTFN